MAWAFQLSVQKCYCRSAAGGQMGNDGSRTVPCANEFSFSVMGPSSPWACRSQGEAVRRASTLQFLPVTGWQGLCPLAHTQATCSLHPMAGGCCLAEASTCFCCSLCL